MVHLPPALWSASHAAWHEAASGVLPKMWKGYPSLPSYTAFWFKVFLNGDRGEFYEAIFGDGAGSLCRSEPMTECYTRNAPAGRL